MEILDNFTVDSWIAVAAIAVPIILASLTKIHVWIWLLFKKHILNRKVEVISPKLGVRYRTLNKQVRECDYLDKTGKLSITTLLLNHKALFQGTNIPAGMLRSADVYVKCYKVTDEAGGTTLVSSAVSITNLLPAVEVELSLSEIIDDWNKKISKVKNYTEKDRIEFATRFHVCFELVHPFLDGNGRIGRALLEEQLSFLFNKIIKFEPNLQAYHDAIQLAVRGDETELRRLILDQTTISSEISPVVT